MVKINGSGNIELKKAGRNFALQCKNIDRPCGLECASVDFIIAKGGFFIQLCDNKKLTVRTVDFSTDLDLDLSKCTEECVDIDCQHVAYCGVCSENRQKAEVLKRQEEAKEEERKKIAAEDEKRGKKKALKLVKKNKK